MEEIIPAHTQAMEEESKDGFEWVNALSQELGLTEEQERKLLARVKEETVPKAAYDFLLAELIKEKADVLNDALTGLPNSKVLERDPDLSFGNKIPEGDVEKRAPVEKKPDMFLAMCDLDGFKNVNDIEGHLAGNERLLRVANVIYGAIREDDIAFRFGGDEFGIIFKNTDDADAVAKRLEIIRSRIEELQMGITVSIGAASSENFDNFTELLKAADKAMYQSKQNGRNRVTVYETEPAETE